MPSSISTETMHDITSCEKQSAEMFICWKHPLK